MDIQTINTKRQAIATALFAAEAANPGSPELKSLHAALADGDNALGEIVGEYLAANSEGVVAEDAGLQPLTGGTPKDDPSE